MRLYKKGDKKLLNAWAFYDWANSVYPLVISTAIFPIYFKSITKGEPVNFLWLNSIENDAFIGYVSSFTFIILAVISTPVDHPKIPTWEMTLSSGAVCMNLLSCAQSLGYAAQWLTEWYAYNDKMLEYLGGRAKIDRISGFIYLGHKVEEPNERRRPDPKAIISYL